MTRSLRNFLKVAAILILSQSPAQAFFLPTASVYLKNESPHDIWVGIYQAARTDGFRINEPFCVKAQSEFVQKLPSLHPIRTRTLFFGKSAEQLPARIERSDSLSFLEPVKVGLFSTKNLSFIEKDNTLTVGPTKIIEAEKERAHLRKALLARRAESTQNAHLTHNPHRSHQEHIFIKKRRKKGLPALTAFLKKPVSVVYQPHISICASGGGFRAMIATLGLLDGLAKIGLLDCIEYAAGVSGGTWALFPWIVHGGSIHEYYAQLKNQLTQGLRKNVTVQLNNYKKNARYNNVFDRSTSLIDLYGHSLSQVLLAHAVPNHTAVTLSDVSKTLHPSQHPFPIATAVTTFDHKKGYEWFEFSPYDIRLSTSNYVFSPWAFGRTFYNGHTTNHCPELTLGYYLGVWGSAFSMSLKEILDRIPQFILNWLPRKIANLINEEEWGATKLLASYQPNPLFGFASLTGSNRPHIAITDAGHDNNHALTPLLHPDRHQDLLIVLDSGKDEYLNKQNLRKSIDHLKRIYPKIIVDEEKALNQPISFFPSTTPSTPSVLYITLTCDTTYDPDFDPKNSLICDTTNFIYSPEQVDKLAGLIVHCIQKNADLFRHAIKHVITQKKEAASFLTKVKSLFW